MDWQAIGLSLQLAAWTAALLLPLAIALGRFLARGRFPGRRLIEAVVALPLVLPPTVLGFYLLTLFGDQSAVGRSLTALFGKPLVFSFSGLVVASLIANLPFAVQPIQRAFETIGRDLREAAYTSGLGKWETFRRIELPLAWPGLVTALVLVVAHTIGEFGVVLMVGGNIPGETRTAAIALYDRVQALDDAAAGAMAAFLLTASFLAIAATFTLAGRERGRRD
ncbi:MAG: molybdate ABC transporter permease subunit [Alphaproteobacteria bacterium]|nr:molybdate ABC transporter permease subunit [Alphaproteobacteria bacterium]